jgi:hypothetical protein
MDIEYVYNYYYNNNNNNKMHNSAIVFIYINLQNVMATHVAISGRKYQG